MLTNAIKFTTALAQLHSTQCERGYIIIEGWRFRFLSEFCDQAREEAGASAEPREFLREIVAGKTVPAVGS